MSMNFDLNLLFHVILFFFFQQILNYSQVSDAGKQFLKRLSNITVQSTLFVPHNDGLLSNEVKQASCHVTYDII